MKNVCLLVLSIVLFAACGKPSGSHSKKTSPKKTTTFKTPAKKDCAILKKKPIELEYTNIHPDPQMHNLHMIGSVGRYGVDGDKGKILRVLRYKNIADAVEARYSWIPSGTILAMMAQESGGADLLPNGNNDGGIGSIHMQGATAYDFGLDTYESCHQMVCKKHGKDLRYLIVKTNADKKELVDYDDRFNPVLNLDAVGRMLTYHRCGSLIKGHNGYQTAICRYSGSYNYKKYYRKVEHFRKLLSSEKYLSKIKTEFNRRNDGFTVNGTKCDFERYISVCQEQNENYGLEKYKKLGEFKF